ncbi:methyltransferase domain-containing protein [Colletotrichum musicola]|uniref:Methyltransferase domain-containing protein n=1 Tax=Colletotrichum musicola TaxID=2175873 RepID=A0A8H6JIA9_9PEZI|nr:methyltransferase domain-containing protein [Colletotrichum musicola]
MSTNATATAAASETSRAEPLAGAQAPQTGEGGNEDALVVDESVLGSTASVTSSVLEYRVENGRRYHSFKEGKYLAPNDERETERLDLQHNLFILTFDDKLGTAPPNDPGHKVGRVLDVGTGSGSWAIDFGDEHPEAEVTEVDLPLHGRNCVPPNVRFEIDDIEAEWTFSRPFDYIHSRTMTGSIADWNKYIKQCYDNLNPGGYLELNDIDAVPVSDDGTLTKDTAIMKNAGLCLEAMVKFGAPFQKFERLEGVMRDAGFVDVHVRQYKWPTNGWPRDRRLKELGYWNYQNLAPNFEAFIMAPLTRALGWSKEEVMLLAMEVRKDLGNKDIHAYYKM